MWTDISVDVDDIPFPSLQKAQESHPTVAGTVVTTLLLRHLR